jgi:hypothetical protein
MQISQSWKKVPNSKTPVVPSIWDMQYGKDGDTNMERSRPLSHIHTR